MIKSRRKFNLPDITGRTKNDVTLEINWNDVVKDCKYIRLTLGDTKAIVSKSDFMFLAFMIANEDEQTTLINPHLTFTNNRETSIQIMAKKDIKKGEFIVTPVTISTNPKTGFVTLK